jgi:hypothetical protein
MSTKPEYIRIQGKLYRRAKEEEQKRFNVRDELRTLVSKYDALLEQADIEAPLERILQLILFVRSASKDVEKTLPDILRPKNWGVMDEFSDTLRQLDVTYRRLRRAWRAADRRRPLKNFAVSRGVDIPISEFERCRFFERP